MTEADIRNHKSVAVNRNVAASNDAFLSIEAVSRRFGSVIALNDVSLHVHEGETICLVGHSGCGKSTLLRIIAGIDHPDHGRICLNGRELTGSNHFVEPEDRQIGFMFQDYALFPHMNVTQNILFGLKRLSRSEARARCDALLTRLGLQHLAERFPHMLSGGEQQRVALARALAPQPRVLLMDEPFSNLDRRLRDELRDETLSLLKELRTTVIMVTHDPEEALSSGDRVVLLREGRIIQTGTGQEIYHRPNCAYSANFFCPFNVIPGICRNGCVETPLGRFHAPHINDGAKAGVFIRPQSIAISPSAEGVPATVTGWSLRGEIEQVALAVPECDVPLKVRSTQKRHLTSGQPVNVTFMENGTFVFPL